jgi:hypothetical protein
MRKLNFHAPNHIPEGERIAKVVFSVHHRLAMFWAPQIKLRVQRFRNFARNSTRR